MSSTKHIFISYARRDTKRVDRLVEALRGAGYSVWIDRGGISGASLWRTEIVVAIRDSNAFVIALSPHSVASDNVRKELDLCEQYRRHVVPLRLADTPIPDEMQYQLAGVQYVDCHDFDKGFEELCRTLENLNVERLDLPTAADAPAKPASSGWWGAPGVFWIAAVLAAAVHVAAAGLTQGKTDVPASLTPLMSASLFDGGAAGLFSLGLFGVLAALSVVSAYSRPLRPAIVRLAPFLLLTIPLAIWKGQYIAASLGVIAGAAVGAWWSRWQRGPHAAHALILLAPAVLGVTAQHLLAREPAGGSIIGMTPFEIVDHERLESTQADFSNKLRQKLSAVFSRAGLNVEPPEFNEETLNNWSFENWSVERVTSGKLRLLLKTTLTQCASRAQPGDPRPASYTWLAEPYGRNLEPLPEFASASGSDTRVLSLRIAFKLLDTTPVSLDLSEEQRNAAMRAIAQDALTVARSSSGMAAQIESATSLLAQPAIDRRKLNELLDSLTAAGGACDEAARMNRNAQKANASSYGEGGP